MFVSISPQRLLDVAKKCRVRTVDGKLLFGSSLQDETPSVSDELDKLQDHLDKEEGEKTDADARSLFTSADILWMIRHEIDNVRCGDHSTQNFYYLIYFNLKILNS